MKHRYAEANKVIGFIMAYEQGRGPQEHDMGPADEGDLVEEGTRVTSQN